MPEDYPLVARDVPKVDTPNRRIVTPIPVPDSIPVLERLRAIEPVAMQGQPAVLWDRAEGIHVYDRWDNKWLDWSSGVVVTNAGHAHPAIRNAMRKQIEHGLLHNYCFPSEVRARLVEALANVAPDGLKKVFLLTTGSESTECAIKLMRTHGLHVGGDQKISIVTFHNGFHGRTMGAQMAGGSDAQKSWIVNLDPAIVQVPFPDDFRQADTRFEVFLESLDAQGVKPSQVAGVMLETFQGGSAKLAPTQYIRKLRRWCDEHDVVMTFDEVQAAFGRTGRFWGFEHYDIVPDLICCGKGISSGMPISAVIGKPDLLDQYPPGSMTSTHTGNPVCSVSALENLRIIQEENLVERARAMGDLLSSALDGLKDRFAPHIGAAAAVGMVGALQMVRADVSPCEPDHERATEIVRHCVEKGLLMFAPVGVGGGTVKIAPPLITPEDAIQEGLQVLGEAIEQVV